MVMPTNKIIDIHNHSLPVDDGAKNIEEAIINLKYLKELGVTDVVLTSHYIEKTKYQDSVLKRKELIKELKDRIKDLNINLYLGNEVFITTSILELLNMGEITTLNGSNYLLIEFPLTHQIANIEEIICELNEMKIVPIIAHPERYVYYQKDYDKLEKVLEYNCLLQCNIESFIGKYGKSAQKLLKKLLKEDKVSILATDLHNINNSRYLEKALKKLNKKIEPKKLEDLLYNNPKKVLENSII